MKDRAAYIIGFMVVVAAVFGAGVTGVYITTQQTVRTNTDLLFQKALVDVFQLGNPAEMTPEEIAQTVRQQIDMEETRRDPETGWEFTLYRAYETPEQTALKAYGFRFDGLGFWAPIEGILAVSPDRSETVGITILQQTETPGLGGRITEPIFTRQFREGIAVTPPEEEKWLVVSKTEPEPGGPAYGRHVEAITGATQTGMAMERILNEHLERFHRAMKNGGKET